LHVTQQFFGGIAVVLEIMTLFVKPGFTCLFSRVCPASIKVRTRIASEKNVPERLFIASL
jgi:hypothetical protein